MLTQRPVFSRMFRPEFRNEDIDLNWMDLDIQSLDAPEILAAGSHVRVKAMSYDGEYGLPTSVWRTPR